MVEEEENPSKKMKKILFQAFNFYSEKRLLTIGLLGTIAASLIGFVLHARFDGILDVHFVESIKIYEPLLDNLIDILNASLIARLPYYLISLANINGYMADLSERMLGLATQQPEALQINPLDITAILIFAFASLLLLIYYLYLLFKGYQVATNAKGALPIGLFVIAVILAEVISKLIIYFIA